MQRLLLRSAAAGVVIATFIAAGLVGATAIRARVDDANRANENDTSRRAARRVTPPESGDDSVRAASRTPAAALSAAPPAAPAAAAQTTSSATSLNGPSTSAVQATPPITPVLPMGPSSLPDSVTVLRGDSDIVVSFDVPMVRTRRPEKFEQLVRTTLPAIYGSTAREALLKIPPGELASQGDLVDELPRKGMRIPVGDEWVIRLFPETRPGQDGPIVVRYRASVVAAGR